MLINHVSYEMAIVGAETPIIYIYIYMGRGETVKWIDLHWFPPARGNQSESGEDRNMQGVSAIFFP